MARLATPLIAVIILAASFANAYSQTAEITIDAINENRSISGKVTGLDKTTVKGYRVVVYVHTDVWYIHPYAGQGEGQSWSSIGEDGSWSVATVRRDFPADEISALVVGMGYDFPARTASIASVRNIAIVKKRLKGTAEYGKL